MRYWSIDLLAPSNIVLGAQRQPSEVGLQEPQPPQHAGKEDAETMCHLLKSSFPEAPAEVGSVDEHRVLVEGAGADGSDGEWIERVMLEDDASCTWAKHASEFLQQ